VISGEMANDRMTLKVESASMPVQIDTRLADAVRDVTKLRCEVELCAPGSLPNDGKVIDDTRRFE
jgi:phenylacetate-CoA ligase